MWVLWSSSVCLVWYGWCPQVLLVAVVRRLPRGGISLSKAEEEGCERFNDSTARCSSVVCVVERTNLCGCRQADRGARACVRVCVC